MKERPIPFSTEMVQAILEGRKAQTRRVVKHPERYEGIRECDFCCPYGQVGDKLWVRETWCNKHPFKNGICPDGPCYKATDEGECGAYVTGQCWQSSRFMPRWASRITLEITKVRVERLQEITEHDAKAEGDPIQGLIASENSHVEWFKSLWDFLNVKRGYSWESNPWVWVIEFTKDK